MNKIRLSSIPFLFFSLVLSASAQAPEEGNSHSEKRSNVDYGTKEIDDMFHSIAVDLSAFGQDARVMYFDNTCIIIGKNNNPFIINASTSFYPSALPDSIRPLLSKVISASIFKSVDGDVTDGGISVEIPPWLLNCTQLKYLTLEKISLTPLFFRSHPTIEHLILIDPPPTCKSITLKHVFEMPSLKYLVHSDFLTEIEVREIEAKSKQLKVLLEGQYDSMIEKGEIILPR